MKDIKDAGAVIPNISPSLAQYKKKIDEFYKITMDYGKLNQIVVSTIATMSDMVFFLGETNTGLGTWYEASDLASRNRVVSLMRDKQWCMFTFLVQSYVNFPTSLII